DVDALDAQLRAVREAGVAWTHEELELGLDALAAPVFGVDGAVVAALDVSGPSLRLRGRSDLEQLAMEGAAGLSHRLGYRGGRPGT
ncbi:MAG TPA: IclR family transcriptional regulator C-terminal domain-containing protein, partial [Candidatus Udaeobacter sp.]|nr:IclR family transcriptional regulator C-terminal domain-containing protein [Candidatus Udaeobacter sp.]